MALRLDPRLPLVWRTPDSLQIGIDRPRVVLEDVTHADELVIAALAAGISRSGAEMIGRAAGLDDDDVRHLLAAVDPALERAPEPRVPVSVVVCGGGETADRLRDVIARSGMTTLAEPDDPSPPGLAVIVAHYVISPELHGRWLRRDIPHLPIVFSDGAVRIGPLVRPGEGPCLYCLELTRTTADHAWPAVAAQLWGRRSPAESALVSAEVAAIAARLVLSWAAGRPDQRPVGTPSTAASAIDLDVASGESVLTTFLPHPECGCISVAGAGPAVEPAQAGPGIATGASRGRGPIRLTPRTGEGAAVPG